MVILPLIAVVGLTALALVILLPEIRALTTPVAVSASPAALKISVLGDSDSHYYDDFLDQLQRGGEFHDYALGWPELWSRLRPGEVNFGPLGHWGTGYRLARLRDQLGLLGRAPAKYDYQNNYAVSGLKCESLQSSWPYQARWLIKQLGTDPPDHGLVVIRIGVNDLGQLESQDEHAADGLTDSAMRRVKSCTEHIIAAAKAIAAASPQIRIALLGMARDYNLDIEAASRFNAAQAARIESVFSEFDGQLNAFAQQAPNVLFINDHDWHVARVGSRLDRPPAASFAVAGLQVLNRRGDHPQHLILADRHAGTLYNGLWLNHVIEQLNAGFGLSLTTLTEQELVELISPALKDRLSPASDELSDNPDKLKI